MKNNLFKILPCNLLSSNIQKMYVLCLVIPTKVDTSQVPLQNVNWTPTVKAQINITSDSEDSPVPTLSASK